MSKLILEFPTLYSLSSKGKVKQWEVKVMEFNGDHHVVSSHGYVGCKIVDEVSSPILGKNKGRKNETTAEAQAILEAASKWRGKKDKNYQEEIPTTIDEFKNKLPMLAHKWVERKHNIVYPCYVQPKLNGVRCLAEELAGNEFQFTSRGGKEYTTLRHIEEHLADLTNDMYELSEYLLLNGPIDGEIFNPEMPFEDITSAVKKLKDNTSRLQYWIYDIADTKLTFEERLVILEEMQGCLDAGSPIVIVPTFLVNNEEELMEYHKEFSLKYEGTMIRNMKGKYVFDYRSTDLLKLKDFLDEEFTIIGAKTGSGSDAGTVVFRCGTKDEKEFDVKPEGSRAKRKEWFDDIKNLIGKQLTVRFQNYSEYGIPVFPVGIVIRDYE